MEKKVDRGMVLIGISLLVLIIGITTVFFIDKMKSGGQSDIRAKAGVDTGLKYEGIVASVNTTENSFVLTNVAPYDNPQQKFGQWTVGVPSNQSVSSFAPGTTVIVTVEAKNFDIKTHTMIAKGVETK
jgi:hypothetical protein